MHVYILNWLGGLLGSWTGFSTLRTLIIAIVGAAGYDAVKNAKELFDSLIKAAEWRERLASWVLEKAGIEIAPANLENPEAWKIALGKRGAKMINESIGTSMTTIYPADELKTQIQLELEKNILNGGGGLVSAELVFQIKKQLQEKALLSRGLSGNAVAAILPTDDKMTKLLKKRANNRAYQREYRKNKRRLQVWVDDDMQSAVQEFEAKIKTILANRPVSPRPVKTPPTGSGVIV